MLWFYVRYVTRKTYLFPQTHRIGFPKVATRLYADTCAAKRGSSVRQGTDHLCGCSADLYNAEEVRGWMHKRTHSIEDGYWLLKQYPCSHATAEGLSFGQPFCHSQTTANVQVDVSCFRSFDAAYEESVLQVNIKALYLATYIRACWVSPFPAWICTEFLPRFLPRRIVRKVTAESCRKSKHVLMDIRVHLHWKIEEFIGKM